MFDKNSYADLLQCCSAKAVAEATRNAQEAEKRKRDEQIDAYTASLSPLAQQLGKLRIEMQQQNEIFKQQLELQKQQIEEAENDAKKAKIFSWVSFGSATVISVGSLIVAVIALFQ